MLLATVVTLAFIASRAFKSDTKSVVANEFKSDTKSDVANKLRSLTISVVASVFKSDTKSEVINDDIPATLDISEDKPATVFIFDIAPATVFMLLVLLATDVTLLAIPDTVVTSLDIPAIVVTSTDAMLVTALPLLSNVRTLDALLAFAGSVTVADIESVSNNFTDLSDCWSISANFAYILSKSVLSDDISNDPVVGKSDVLSIEMSRIIVMISSAEAPVLPKVIVPPAPNS